MLQYIYYRLEKVTPLVHGVKSYSTVYIYILPTGRNCAVKSYSMYVDGFSELQLYTPVKWKLYLFSSQYDKRNFFMSIINKKIALANWLSLKKIASAYQRQIALKIMLLPIQIDDMYNRKQIKRGGGGGVLDWYTAYHCLCHVFQILLGGLVVATMRQGSLGDSFSIIRKCSPFRPTKQVSFTDFRPQFMCPDCVRMHKSLSWFTVITI